MHQLPRPLTSPRSLLLVRSSRQNAAQLLNALRSFGFGDLTLSVDDVVNPGNVVQLGRPPNRIDSLTGISGVDFDDASSSRVQAELDGLPFCFLGWQSLIENKQQGLQRTKPSLALRAPSGLRG